MGLRDAVIQRKALLRICILAIVFAGIGGLALWDYYRVERDFRELKTLLREIRPKKFLCFKEIMGRFTEASYTDKNKQLRMLCGCI
jgi:hypothetical protein